MADPKNPKDDLETFDKEVTEVLKKYPEMTPEEVIETIIAGVSDSHPGDLETDNDGQLVVYTGIYRHKDGSYHEEPEDLRLDPSDIPSTYPVQPLKEGEEAQDKVTCNTCGLSWDDAKPTSMTPAPSARCPFEHYHK